MPKRSIRYDCYNCKWGQEPYNPVAHCTGCARWDASGNVTDYDNWEPIVDLAKWSPTADRVPANKEGEA